ncbi:MAG: ISNCY family transposase [Methylobacter sp.]
MQDIITMSNKELHRVEILQKLIDKRVFEHEAAKQLDLSVRQIRRLKKAYKADGAVGVVSKKRGNPSNHKYPDAVKELALAYVHKSYSDFKPTFACEKLSENHGLFISRETLRKWMIDAGLWIPKNNRLKRAYQPRNRRECYGELIQIDGSSHDWFEGRAPKCTLLVYIDDATGKLMECHFVKSESTFSYFDSTRRYLEKHGKPVAFYSDKHCVFRINRTGELGGDGVTQFGRALSELNIDIICANTPQAKGRVERVNRTLQDRLIKEMRLMNISDIEQGNQFLPEFIDKFNKKFGVQIDSKNMHRELLPHEDLNEIFSWQENRTLSKNLTLQYDKALYLIEDSVDNRSLARNKVTVFEYFDGAIKIKWNNRELPYRIFDKIKKVDQGEIVSNKRLGAVLNFIKEKQDKNDEKRSAGAPSRQHLGEVSTTIIRRG